MKYFEKRIWNGVLGSLISAIVDKIDGSLTKGLNVLRESKGRLGFERFKEALLFYLML